MSRSWKDPLRDVFSAAQSLCRAEFHDDSSKQSRSLGSHGAILVSVSSTKSLKQTLVTLKQHSLFQDVSDLVSCVSAIKK